MHLGQHLTEEHKAKLLATHLGSHQSAESRKKMSISRKGNTNNLGHPHTPETKAKMSASHMGNKGILGQHLSPETRAKLSVIRQGRTMSPESIAKTAAANWRGGPAVFIRKANAKRRLLGFNALNVWFVGCEGHHVDNEQVIYMPKELHRSIFHRQRDGLGMAKMNAIAYNFLFKQEVDAAIAAREVEHVIG